MKDSDWLIFLCLTSYALRYNFTCCDWTSDWSNRFVACIPAVIIWFNYKLLPFKR